MCPQLVAKTKYIDTLIKLLLTLQQKTFLVDQLIHAYVNNSVQFNLPSEKS